MTQSFRKRSPSGNGERRELEPVPYSEFLAREFHKSATIEAIIADSQRKEFARVLLAGKTAGYPGILLDSYVHRVGEATRIRRNEDGWMSVHSLFEIRARDKGVFRWVLQTEPQDLAIDDHGDLYFSLRLATSVLSSDREELRKRVYGHLIVIVVLVGILASFGIRALLGGAA